MHGRTYERARYVAQSVRVVEAAVLDQNGRRRAGSMVPFPPSASVRGRAGHGQANGEQFQDGRSRVRFVFPSIGFGYGMLRPASGAAALKESSRRCHAAVLNWIGGVCKSNVAALLFCQ